MRIVSCVPSLSELVFFLRPESLAGRTRFCILPADISKIPSIGGTKNLDIQKIASLKPDLILAVKEENEKEQIEALSAHFPVKVFDIKNEADALKANAEIAVFLEAEKRFLQWRQRYEDEKAKYKPGPELSVVYLIWQNPFMSIGGDTFIHDSLIQGGFRNVYSSSLRYPETTWEEMEKKNPDAILLSSEPFPFREKHLDAFRDRIPGKPVLLVDGTYFSWYGSRMLQAPAYFSEVRTRILKTNP